MLFSVVWLVRFVCVCGEKRRAMACSSSVNLDSDCSGMGPRCISCGLLQSADDKRGTTPTQGKLTANTSALTRKPALETSF